VPQPAFGRAGTALPAKQDMGQLLSGPVTDKQSGDGWSKDMGLVWGYSCMQGWRERMEDAHLAIPSLGSHVVANKIGGCDPGWNETAVFGVMDGHGGEHVAHFCERYLPGEIARGPSEDPGRALSAAFYRMDEMLSDPASLDELRSLSNGPRKASFKSWSANPEYMGCTAVVCCVRRDTITVANAGDSRAVLCRRGKAIDMSEDHKPNLPGEIARINRAGGCVMEQHIGGHTHYRVNGNLNLSRSIGDLTYKQNWNLSPQDQMICCTPDVRTFRRLPGDEFLVLACDGVWDVLSSQDIVDYVRPRLHSLFDFEQRCGGDSHDMRTSIVAEGVLDTCLSPNLAQTFGIGGDNMTIVIVAFLDQTQVSNADSWIGQALTSSWLCPYA